MFVCRSEIGPKHYDKLNPEPGPTRKAWPDLQLCMKLGYASSQGGKTEKYGTFVLDTSPTRVGFCVVGDELHVVGR